MRVLVEFSGVYGTRGVQGGDKVNPSKIEAVRGWSRPTSPTRFVVLWDWLVTIGDSFRVSRL